VDGSNGSAIETKLFSCQLETQRDQTESRRTQGKIHCCYSLWNIGLKELG